MTPSEPFPHLTGSADPRTRRTDPPSTDGRAAFRSVFETEVGFVWNALRRLGVPDRDRADVAQELFIAVERQLHRYDDARPLRPWLYAFAIRCAADYRKRSANRYEVLAESEAETGSDDVERIPPGSADDDLATRLFLSKALARLDDDARALVVMYEIEGFSIAEIAGILEVPLQTAYSRLKAAREALSTIARRLGVHVEGGAR